MTLSIDAKFERKLTCAFKNDMRNFKSFYQSARKIQIGTLMLVFYPKQKMYDFEIYRGVMCHDDDE